MQNWYDLIAGIYDYSAVRLYKKPRAALVDKMNIQNGDRVLIVGCGTGLLFSYVQEKLKGKGQIIGLDASENMLRRAQDKIDKNAWTNIRLIHEDARNLSPQFITDQLQDKRPFDHVIGELSFSVMPDWKYIMRRAIDLLKAEGRLGVLDGYRAKRDILNGILNTLPRSDISRPISQYAQSLTKNYTSETFGFTQIIFVGVGQKSGPIGNLPD